MRMFIPTILVWMNIMIVSISGEIPSDMTAWIDSSVQPCDNFYQYTCGKWIKQTIMRPSDVSKRASFDAIDGYKAKVINGIIQKKHPRLGEFWESCRNIDKITELGNTPLHEDLRRISNAKTKAAVLELAGEFSRTGTNAFTKFSVIPDLIDAKLNVLYAKTADLVLPSSSLYSDENFSGISTEYRQYINDLMKLSGYKSLGVADTVISMEKKLVAIKRNEKEDKSKYWSISTAIKKFPLTIGAFSTGLGIEKPTGSFFSLKKGLKIYIHDAEVFTRIEELLESMPVESIRLYVVFAMVHSRIDWLGNDFYHVWFKFFRKRLNGMQQPLDRYSICMDHLLQYVPDLIGQYYSKEAFNEKRKERSLEMIDLIKKAMGEHITESNWLKNKEKDKAIHKLNEILPLIGEPTEPKSYPFMLSHDNYPVNIYKILSHAFDLELNKVGQLVNRTEWHKSAADAKAQYNEGTNTIIFTAAMLQAPLFDGDKVHPARNFGGIGSIMGHEITHGFDSIGSLYNGVGRYDPWWSTKSAKIFKDQAQCFENQYSLFKVEVDKGEMKHVNGELTLDENIADNGGVALAWDAYHDYMTRKKPKTNGVSAEEGDRMFFIAFGQSLCSKVRGEVAREDLLTDSHSPAEWRVNGVVMNNSDFAKVFGCKSNTPMNPSKKCHIWKTI